MGTVGTPQGGYSDEKFQVIARVDEGSVVTATNENGDVSIIFKVDNGISKIRGLSDGNWTIEAKVGSIYQKKETVLISGDNQREIIFLHINKVPDFEATGLVYKIVNDDDYELNEFSGTTGNWKIRFEQNINGSYGTIKFSDLHNQKVDIFLVGGGGNADRSYAGWGSNGGGGGYTKTFRNIELKPDFEYRVVIGGPCGSSKFYASDNSVVYTAAGGQSGYRESDDMYGGNGGSGGGSGHGRTTNGGPSGDSGNGGSNGSDGTKGANGGWWAGQDYWQIISYAGKGQISTPGPNGETGNTYEFGEVGSTLYSSGGGGGSFVDGHEGVYGDGIRGANSGAGGSGNTSYTAKQTGKSGIVIIRNAR